MLIKGQQVDVNDEFEFFCQSNEIDGALKTDIAKEYRQNGMGAVISRLRSLNHEGILKEEKEHTLNLIRERGTLAKLLPDPENRLRKKHQEISMTRKFFKLGKEREGD